MRLLSLSLRREIAMLMLAPLTLFLTECRSFRYQPVAVTNLSLERENIAGRVVRLTSGSGALEMQIASIDSPYMSGRALTGHGPVEFRLADATQMEMKTTSDGVRTLTIDQLRQTPDLVKGAQIRFSTKRGDLTLRDITGVSDGWVAGILARGSGPIRVNLQQFSKLEARELNGPKTAVKSIGLGTGILLTVVGLFLLLKGSCPFVYIDRGDGWEFVGEAYAGAAFRSIQRDDLLPLPAVGATRSIGIRLRNEARETQYTDRAELVIADHTSNVRALSSFDGRVILVSDSRTAVRARDRSGRDLLPVLAEVDEELAVTNPDAAAVATDDALEDQITADFAMPRSGTPVLEIVGGNTPWLDVVFNRFFAAMGSHLPVYVAQGNDSTAGPRIQRWRQREGVDLIVERRNGDTWERIAVVPTAGPAALREVAIPLPAGRTTDSAILTVRLRGGLGFWRFDRLTLSLASDSHPMVQRIAPVRARAAGGTNKLGTIAFADGDYDALEDMNQSLDMTFTLPPLAEGLTRTAFLDTSGYYNLHMPVQARWQPVTLKAIRDEPGALSRFGRDLAREYVRRDAGASRAGDPRSSR